MSRSVWQHTTKRRQGRTENARAKVTGTKADGIKIAGTKLAGRKAAILLGLFLLFTGCAAPLGESVPGKAEDSWEVESLLGMEAGGGEGDASGAGGAGMGARGDGESLSEESALEELTVHFIDVGQGDCTLITCGGESLLIDAGDNDQGIRVQNYLQKQGIETLDYVVCTHPDADHIGGIDVVLYKFDCGMVLMTEEEKDSKTYRDVADAMREKGYQKTLPAVGDQYTLGDGIFTIVGPYKEREESNNNSIAILLTHGENTFLFTGDAEEKEELDMVFGDISLSADVYKAGHHGSRTSSCEEFLDVVQPAYAVISCGTDNSYGHPHAEVMNRFRAMGVEVFRTDEQGSILVTSDGKNLVWNCAPLDDWIAGEPVGTAGEQEETAGEPAGTAGEQEETESEPVEPSGEQQESSEAQPYICNINSKKFHYPDCPSAEQMSEKNRRSVTATRQELIEQGYEPCGNCNP